MTILTTLVTGTRSGLREAVIAHAIDPSVNTAVILEGLPDGKTPLSCLITSPILHIVRIAPGCFCCTGNLTMRVTLNRILRRSPQRLFIGLATVDHLEALRAFLAQAPYDKLLILTQDMPA